MIGFRVEGLGILGFRLWDPHDLNAPLKSKTVVGFGV